MHCGGWRMQSPEYWTTNMIILSKFWTIIWGDLCKLKDFPLLQRLTGSQMSKTMIYIRTSLSLLFYVFSGSERIKSEKKTTELLLLLNIEQLEKQLQKKRREKKKKQKVEVMFRQAANSPSIVQIPIHVADLQKCYGHKSGDIEIQQVESCRYNAEHNNVGPNIMSADQCRHNNWQKLDFSRFLSIINIPNRKGRTTINTNMSGCKEAGCMTQMAKS